MAFALITSAASVQGMDGSTTGAVNTTGANVLVLVVTYSSTEIAPSVTDSKGNGYFTGSSTNDGTVTTAIAYCLTPTVGSGHTWSALGSFSKASIAAIAFSVTGSVSSYDTSTAANSSTPGSITPSAANEVLVCGASYTPGITAGTACSGGYTVDQHAQDSFLSGIGISLAHLIQTTATASNPTWSGGGGGAVGSVLLALKIGGGSVDTPLDGSAAAVTSAGSTAVLGLGESGAAGAVTVAGSTAVLGPGTSAAAGAVTSAGSTAALDLGTRAGAAAIAVTPKTALLDMGTGTAPGAVVVTGAHAMLTQSSHFPPGAVSVVGAWARLVAMSPLPPPAPPPPPPYVGSSSPAPPPPPRGTEVYGNIPPWLGSGPQLPDGTQ